MYNHKRPKYHSQLPKLANRMQFLDKPKILPALDTNGNSWHERNELRATRNEPRETSHEQWANCLLAPIAWHLLPPINLQCKLCVQLVCCILIRANRELLTGIRHQAASSLQHAACGRDEAIIKMTLNNASEWG